MTQDTQDTGIFSSFLQDVGDRGNPITASSFDAIVKEELGLAQDADMPMFTAFESRLRSSQLTNLFVEDKNDIDEDEIFEYQVPCPLAHPRLCVTEHSLLMPDIILATKNFRKLYTPKKPGSLVAVFGICSDGIVDGYEHFLWLTLEEVAGRSLCWLR